jgi:hypothetical protein
MVGDMKFKLGQVVYLHTDLDQLERIVTEISFSGNSMSDYITMYELSNSEDISKHYSSEIRKNINTTLKLGL